MRVLLATTSYPSSGAPFNGVFIRAQARALVERGHEVRVLVPHVFDADPVEESEPGLSVRRVPYGSDGRLLSDRSGVPLAMVARLLFAWDSVAREEAREWAPDIVHAHWAIPSGRPAATAAAAAGAPLVVTVHGADVRMACSRPRTAGALVRGVLRRADAVIAVSRALADELEHGVGLAGRPVEFIPMGADASVFAPRSRSEARTVLGLPHGARIVLGAGALVALKRFGDVIDAMSAVRSRHAEALLLIAGDGPERAHLELQASEAGLADSVRFLGAVDQERLALLLAASDVLVLASEREGLPVVLMEAAAAGVPTVATDVGGSAEAVRLHPLGQVVTVGDVDGLVAAVARVLAADQPDLRASALEPGSRYTLDGSVDRIVELYAALLGGRS